MVSRRDFLRVSLGTAAGVAATSLAGCTGTPTPTPASSAPPETSDAAARAAIAAAEVTLIAAYDQALAAFPDQASQLQAFREAHESHWQALGAPQSSPTSAPSSTAAAATAEDTRVRLRRMEARAAVRCQSLADQTAERSLTETIVLIGAAEAQHAYALSRALPAAGEASDD